MITGWKRRRIIIIIIWYFGFYAHAFSWVCPFYHISINSEPFHIYCKCYHWKKLTLYRSLIKIDFTVKGEKHKHFLKSNHTSLTHTHIHRIYKGNVELFLLKCCLQGESLHLLGLYDTDMQESWQRLKFLPWNLSNFSVIIILFLRKNKLFLKKRSLISSTAVLSKTPLETCLNV